LNGVGLIAVILSYFIEFGSFGANCVTVGLVKVGSTLSVIEV